MIQRVGADDPRLDSYRHVADAAWLARQQLFVAEGRLVVQRVLAMPTYTVESVLVTETTLAAMSSDLAAAACDVLVCDRSIVNSVTGFNFHRGCLALVRRPAAAPIDTLMRTTRLLALERVGNPDNVGGLFRTAAALEAGGVVLDPASADPLYRKAIRTSMAATLRVPWVRVDSWPAPLQSFQSAGFKLIALTPDPRATTLREFCTHISRADRLMLMVGSEGQGLTQGARRLADALVRIPVHPTVDSLNVVVAAAIAFDRFRFPNEDR